MSPVPLGTQTAVLSWSTRGTPVDRTRVADTTQLAVTHGDGAVPTTNGQAATVYVVACPIAGCPESFTRGSGAVGCA
jgi:hypothetical protein